MDRSWADYGAQLIKLKQSGPPGTDTGSAGAYLSEPIDVSGPGEYTLVFRVSGDFTITPPSAIAFDTPADAQFHIRPLGESVLNRNSDGSQTLLIPIRIPFVDARYARYSVWIY